MPPPLLSAIALRSPAPERSSDSDIHQIFTSIELRTAVTERARAPVLVHMVDSKTAKTSRARRFLRNREAKLNENPKTALLVRGQKTSGLINSILIDLFMLKKPHGALLRVEHAATLVPRRGTHPTDCLRRRGRRAPEAAQRGASI